MFAKELHRIDPGKYLDDEFRELYDFIAIEPPEESADIAESSAGPSRSQSIVQRYFSHLKNRCQLLTWL